VQVRAELADRIGLGGVLVIPVPSLLRTETVDAVLAQARQSGQALLWLAVFGDGRPSALPAAGLWRAVREISEQAVVSGLESVAVPVAVAAPRTERTRSRTPR
jgi:hypothetical protein